MGSSMIYSDRINTLIVKSPGLTDYGIVERKSSEGDWLSLGRNIIPVWMLLHELVFIWKEVEEAVGEDLGDELRAWQ